MSRHSHELKMQQDAEYVRATCSCGKWKVDLLISNDDDLMTTVAHLMHEHENHLDRLGGAKDHRGLP
jgi:hypothetical protein